MKVLISSKLLALYRFTLPRGLMCLTRVRETLVSRGFGELVPAVDGADLGVALVDGPAEEHEVALERASEQQRLRLRKQQHPTAQVALNRLQSGCHRISSRPAALRPQAEGAVAIR